MKIKYQELYKKLPRNATWYKISSWFAEWQKLIWIM